MTDRWKSSLLAGGIAFPIAAARMAYSAAAPARATDPAELMQKSANGISPVPTSPSRAEIVEMELLQRVYIMPSDVCGWAVGVSSESFACGSGRSCINIGNYRDCCQGPTTDCATMAFATRCIPSTSLKSAGTAFSCGLNTMCCHGSEFPECGTMLFSFSTEDYSKTYTNIGCWGPGSGTTYQLQDYPADGPDSTTTVTSTGTTTRTTTSSLLSTSTTPSPSHAPTSNPAFSQGPTATPTSTPAPLTNDAKSNPAGAIAGGVVGGLAVIALLILGILYILYRRKPAQPPPSAPDANNNFFQQSPPPHPNMAEYEYQTTSPQMVHNHDSFVSEMPGTVPDKTAWSPDIHGGGGGGSVPPDGHVMPGYDRVQHAQVGSGSPLHVEGHVVQGYNEVNHGHVGGGGERIDIV